MDSKTNGSTPKRTGQNRDAPGLWASLRARLIEPVIRMLSVPSKTRRGLLISVLYVLMFVLATANTTPDGVDWQPGDVATHDVVAMRDVVNREQTEQLRDRAARDAVLRAEQDPGNWEINPAEALRAEERLTGTFAAMYDALHGDKQGDESEPDGEAEVEESAPSPQEVAEATRAVQEVLDDADIALSSEAVHALAVASEERFIALRTGALDVVRTAMGRERISEGDLERQRAAVALHPTLSSFDAAEREALIGLVQHVMRPNLLLSPEKIDRARQDAVRSVSDVRIREGQIIIRRGDLVESEHMMLLQDLGLLDGRPDFGFMAGIALLLALLFALLGVYLYQQHRDVFQSDAQVGLIGLIMLAVVGLAKVEAVIAWEGAGYLAPVGLAGLLITLLIDSRIAIVVTVALAVSVSALFGLEGRFFVVALAGGLAGVFSVSRVSERSDLTRAGFIIGGINFLAMLGLGLLRNDLFVIQYSFLGLLNGIVAAIATIGLLPYLETLFGITSSIRLLELSNPNHPLLRKLLMDAPGSYHHSMMVGNLGEAAAEAIAADQLLVRVGSQYHDIGKARRPYFFVENQFGGENPHDKISPTLSTLIIMAHVKDGVELAKEYKLPPMIIDFIREHHGTDLIKYFYTKALENAPEDSIDERDFRYAGPKPQSKETAIVMLADGVEAAVRSLSKPSPGRIEGLVRRMVKERLDAGQLDESHLTLRDLDKISDAFVRVLTGIFHQRIEYPEGIREQDLRRLPDAETRRA